MLHPARYEEARAALLPQLEREADHARVPIEALDARLAAALGASPFTPAAVLIWQTTGRDHPCQLSAMQRRGLSRRWSGSRRGVPCADTEESSSSDAAHAAGEPEKDAGHRLADELVRHSAWASTHWALSRAAAARARKAGGQAASERDFSATCIQAAWRGRVGRAAAGRAHRVRQSAQERRSAAAVVIQAAARGWRARRRVSAMQRAVRDSRASLCSEDDDEDELLSSDGEAELLASFDWDLTEWLPPSFLHEPDGVRGGTSLLPRLSEPDLGSLPEAASAAGTGLSTAGSAHMRRFANASAAASKAAHDAPLAEDSRGWGSELLAGRHKAHGGVSTTAQSSIPDGFASKSEPKDLDGNQPGGAGGHAVRGPATSQDGSGDDAVGTKSTADTSTATSVTQQLQPRDSTAHQVGQRSSAIW